jgi:hypothetical protein
MLKHSLVVVGVLIALYGRTAAQTVPIIGANQPDAALTIKVGDGAIDGSRMTSHDMSWRATFHPSKGEPLNAGLWNEQVRLKERDGRKVFVRTVGAVVYGHNNDEIRGYIAHSAIVDAKTLAPISDEHRDFDGSTEKWFFNGTHVEVHKIGPEPGAKEVVTKFDTGVAAYDFTGPMFPFYFKALPLKVGYSGVIPAVGDPDQPLRGVKFKVVRREKVQAGAGGMVDAWVVESIHPGQTDIIRFWITDEESFPIRMELMGDPRETYDMVG